MKVTRQEAIDMLVDQMYNEFNMGQLSLDELVRYGFQGFENRTNAELVEAYNEGLETDETIVIEDTEDYTPPTAKIVVEDGIVIDYRMEDKDGKILEHPWYNLVDLDVDDGRSES